MPSPSPFACLAACPAISFADVLFVLAGIVIYIHRPEFQESKCSSMFSNALFDETELALAKSA